MSEDRWRRGQRIEALFAWVSVEPDGGEGVLAADMEMFGRLTCVPLVGADLDRMESYRAYAEALHKITQRPVKLVRFDHMTVLERFGEGKAQ